MLAGELCREGGFIPGSSGGKVAEPTASGTRQIRIGRGRVSPHDNSARATHASLTRKDARLPARACDQTRGTELRVAALAVPHRVGYGVGGRLLRPDKLYALLRRRYVVAQ